MQLFYSPNSPYARKARIIIHELNLGSRVKEVAVTLPADAKLCVERQRLEIEPRRRDVFAQVAGTNVEARVLQGIEQFARNEVDLAQVRRSRVSARQMSVTNKWAIVCVAFDAFSCRQNDGEAGRLAEPMLGVDRYGDD